MYKDELLKILHNGFIVKSRQSSQEHWQYNIINSIYYDTVILCDTLNKVTQHIQFKAFTNEFEYVVDGNILDSDSLGPTPLIKLKIVSCQRYANIRRFERFLCHIGCNTKLDKDTIGSFSLVTNLCSSGAFIESPNNYDINSLIKIDLLVKDNQMISLNARIVRYSKITSNHGYGIVFTDNTPSKTEALKELIQSLEKFQFSLLDAQYLKQTSASGKNKSVVFLLIDDIKFTRKYIKSLLESYGYNNIYEAANGSEAIHNASVYNPDYLTLDLSMPGIDGIETAKELIKFIPCEKIIIVSAYIDSSSREQLSELGITKFLSKPFEDKKLIELLNLEVDNG